MKKQLQKKPKTYNKNKRKKNNPKQTNNPNIPAQATPHPQGPSWSSHAAGSSPAGGDPPSWCHTRSRHGGRLGTPRSVAAAAGHMWWWCWPPSKDCQPLSARTPPASCLGRVLSAGPGPPETKTEEQRSDWHKDIRLTKLYNYIYIFCHYSS